MEVQETVLSGVLLFVPQVFPDSRGYFFESFQNEHYQQAGLNESFVQDNLSRSTKGTLRGLHYQLQQPQGKLVTVVRGEVFDVAVDIRQGSPTFGKWFGSILSDENHLQLYIPPDFAHGFYVVSEVADFYYKCTDYYVPGDEHGIIWNDSDIAIDWPVTTEPLLSAKDTKLPSLSEVAAELLPKYEG